MAHLITLWSCGTGSVERPDAIRTGLAFDLRNVDLRGRSLRHAALQLPIGPCRLPIESIRLSDPSGVVAYGQDTQSDRQGAIQTIPLTAVAVADLQEASGAFFALDASCWSRSGEPLRLPRSVVGDIRLVALEHSESEGVAA
jgi:hypothetical protein